MGGFETIIIIGKFIFYTASVIVTIYAVIKFIIDIRNYVNKHRVRINRIFSQLRSYFSEEIVITRWKILIPLLFILGFLFISYFTEEKEEVIGPKIDITEFIYDGKTYRGGITIPDLNKSINLVCDFPSYLNITQMFPKTDLIQTEKGYKAVWSDDKAIQLEGAVINFKPPFHIQANFRPSTIKKGDNSKFNLKIVKVGDINKNYNEFIHLNFYCLGCSIKALNRDWIKALESSTYSFYSWTDLDKENINSFEFDIKSEETVSTFLEIMYFSNNFINCSANGMPIKYESRIFYYPQLPNLAVSS